jgi:hypothetical protein
VFLTTLARSLSAGAGIVFLTVGSASFADDLRLNDENPLTAVGTGIPGELTLTSRASNDRFQQDGSVLAPLSLSESGDTLTFAHLAFNYRDGGSESFSGGVGARFYLPERNAVLGFHFQGTVSDSLYGNQIAQFGGGFDLFTESGIDFRGNFYLPESDSHLLSSFTEVGKPFGRGNTVLQAQDIMGVFERGRAGMDFKVEFDVPVLEKLLPSRGYLGVYHFDGEWKGNLTGASAGITVQPTESVSLGAEYYGDEDFFGDHWVFVAAVSAPLEGGELFHPQSWIRFLGQAFSPDAMPSKRNADEMRSLIARNIDRRNWVLPEISDPLMTERKLNYLLRNVIFVNNNGNTDAPRGSNSGSGGFEDPVKSIQAGVNRAARRFGNSGSVVVAGSRKIYREEIFDSGSSVRLYGGLVPGMGDKHFRYGSRARLDGGIHLTGIPTAHVSHFRIRGGLLSLPNPDGIFVENVSEVRILDNRLRLIFQDAIDVEMTGRTRSDIIVWGNSIDRTIDDALDFDLTGNSRSHVQVMDNRFDRTGSDGIEFDVEDRARVSGTVSRNYIRRISSEGIEVDQDDNSTARLRILNNRIERTLSDPLDIDLDDSSRGSYQVANNKLSGFFANTFDIDIDADDSARLRLQIMANRSNSDFNFDEDGGSTFLLEDTLGTNRFRGGAGLDIDPTILPFVQDGFPNP